MRKRSKLHIVLLSTIALTGISAQFNPVSAHALTCTCDGGPNCRLDHGREQSNYTYDPKNMGAAYDAIEKNAMDDADAQAVAKANAALAAAAASGVFCANPCDPAPGLSILHGPPFAGGMDGAGMARSLWEVRYVCKAKKPPPPPPPNFSPVNPGPNVNPPTDGGGPRGPNVALPKIPKCFGLPVDKDDMLDELHRIRTQIEKDLGPLGVNKDDPEFIEWQQQRQANLDAIDDAAKQVEAAPYCPPHDSLFNHVQIGIGVGIGGHDDHDHYHDDRHGHDDDRHDVKHDVKHSDDNHHTSHDDHPKSDQPKTDYPKTDQPPPQDDQRDHR